MTPRLVLDEMHSPVVATELRARSHDVIAVAERADLRALSDLDLYAWAGIHRRTIVTENVKDFAPLVRGALQAGQTVVPVVFTSARSFPRSRRNPGRLIAALDAWIIEAASKPRPPEDWLQPIGE